MCVCIYIYIHTCIYVYIYKLVVLRMAARRLPSAMLTSLCLRSVRALLRPISVLRFWMSEGLP